MSSEPITLNAALLAEICRRHRVARLSLFGSVLSDRFRADSDVDMLVEFQRGASVTYFDLVRLEGELSELAGRRVDLRTPGELSRYFRDRVMRTAHVQYAA